MSCVLIGVYLIGLLFTIGFFAFVDSRNDRDGTWNFQTGETITFSFLWPVVWLVVGVIFFGHLLAAWYNFCLRFMSK